jgi:DNA-binding NarL/FixJ family response regulator
MQLDDALAAALEDGELPEPGDAAESVLTRREAQVLRLVAAGSSNADVANQLTLSVRTVERHIANIYAKIGARGRVDATTYALRKGIAESRTAPV